MNRARIIVMNLFAAAAVYLWYLGGAFQPWSFGHIGRATSGARSLANLYEIGLDFRVNPHLSPYFGYVQGKAAMAAIYPAGKNAMFGYLEMNYRF